MASDSLINAIKNNNFIYVTIYKFKEMYQKENNKIKDSIKYKLTQIAYNYLNKV